ncbi:MAG: prolipoprotein diacylglyceryl transferase [Acidobacteriales bacterium]|nr:prolipoprotein diacylglyceryl transferase [Terriglobales bacterium]
MHPKLITIGDFFIPSYGFFVALGFLAGLWMASRLARRQGLNSDLIVNLSIYCAVTGVLGGKVLMVLFDLDFYLRNPGELFSLTTLRAGGVFYGGLVLALIAAIIYMRHVKLPGWRTADALAPGVALGHAIGRIGCFMAGCCWGSECNLPWAVTFTNPDAHEMFGTPLNMPLHPAQLYQSATEALIFALLYWRFSKPHAPGFILGLYLMLTSTGRFLIEFGRFHEQALPFGGPLSNGQWISMAIFVLGAYIVRRSRSTLRQAV